MDTSSHVYDNEDQILKDLIETNIRQRGIGNPNPVKLGRCIKELERIYGIKNGNNRYSRSENNSNLKTQEELANELGIDIRTMSNYKLLAEMIPEMEELLDTGRCFEFLNEYYGFHQGNGSNQYKQKENNFTLPNGASDPTTQTELADSYGITKQRMNNYMRLANMIPELEELVDTGIVAPTTVMKRSFSYSTVKISLDLPRFRSQKKSMPTTKYLHVELLRRTKREN